MRLTVFAAGKGDCILIRSSKGHHLLIDGGTDSAYRVHVRDHLGALRDAGERLLLVIVSHTDSDHIGGVLRLLDDEVAWRVHAYQRRNGNRRHRRPDVARPPAIARIWHNGFGEQLGDELETATRVLGPSAQILANAVDPWVRSAATDRALLAQSIPQALRLARRLGDEQLGIPLNPGFEPDGLVVMGSPPARTSVGSMDVRLLAPTKTAIETYREAWRDWLRRNAATLEDIRREATDDAGMLRPASDADPLTSMSAAAARLADGLGDRERVTTPNLASIMVLVEEGRRRVLMTGDGHADDLTAGLRQRRLLTDGGLHVDVLKVQHHGSEHNIDEAFARLVTADHYVFSGNGEHENPDVRVVELLARARLGDPDERSPNPEVDRPFTFWFTSRDTVSPTVASRHMTEVESLTNEIAAGSDGRMRAHFLERDSFEIELRAD